MIYFAWHLFSLFISNYSLMILIFNTFLFAISLFCTCWSNWSLMSLFLILRNVNELKVIFPFINIKSELKSHVCRESDKIIKIIRCVDSSNLNIGAQEYWFQTMSTFYFVSWWEELRFLENICNIKTSHSPSFRS